MAKKSSFLSFLLISVRKTFLPKTFSMSEMDVHQIIILNYYKKLQEWWTDDVMEIVFVLTCIETQKVQ